jgi:hypothetical protein
MPITEPTKIVDAFGHDADPTTINPIPETTVTPGAASFDKGFPLLTMTAPAAGGIPPFGQDMNGILFQATSILNFLNAGQTFVYDSGFATAIGGYAQGSILARADHTGFWLCISNGNTTDPDAGGAGWAAINNYGYAALSASIGSQTISALNAARPVVVVSGTLTGNATIVFPTTLQSWLIVNNTTGAFNLTCKTLAGTGVIIPPGGFNSPTGIYGDGTNIYNSFSPLTVPIDQAATPLTLAERTNLGYLLATYFNQSSALENPSIGAVFVENVGHDGFLRKISLANFIAQLPADGLISVTTVGTETTYRIGSMYVKIGTIAQTVANFQAHLFAAAFPTAIAGIVTCVANSNGVEFFGVNTPASRTGFTQYANNTCTVSYIAIGS